MVAVLRPQDGRPVREVAGAEPLLVLEGLTRSFNGRVALAGLSFSVRAGETFGLLGPNGAGKSTAFQILAGLLRPDTGVVRFMGRGLLLDDPSLRTRMGVVFQRSSLDEHLTARENLLLMAQLYALDPATAKLRVEEMLRLTELSERADDRVGTFSGGMKRRLELARALVHGPSVLLMDEPTQGLDEASFRRFWAHLAQLREQSGLTILLTTHRPEEAELCDRLAVLHEGELIACEPPAALAGRVGGDVITLQGSQPEQLQALLHTSLGLSARFLEGRLLIEKEQGHAWVPRIVEALPAGALTSVSVRRPTLADVFVKMTGQLLGADSPSPEAPKKRRRS
ncbi:MAG: ATP-binding cassette domain-containing protein [Myxococcaceae bacterium]